MAISVESPAGEVQATPPQSPASALDAGLLPFPPCQRFRFRAWRRSKSRSPALRKMPGFATLLAPAMASPVFHRKAFPLRALCAFVVPVFFTLAIRRSVRAVLSLIKHVHVALTVRRSAAGTLWSDVFDRHQRNQRNTGGEWPPRRVADRVDPGHSTPATPSRQPRGARRSTQGCSSPWAGNHSRRCRSVRARRSGIAAS